MMTTSTSTTGTLLLLLLQLQLPTTVLGSCTSEDNGWKSSKDCKSYYWCSWGVVGQFYDCIHDELYDETQSKCVNANATNFQCPGLNWRSDDAESDTMISHTTTLSGSLINPGKYYCSEQYIGLLYTGSCGEIGCPSGQDIDCPGTSRCYQMTNCDETVVLETPAPTPQKIPAAYINTSGGNPDNRFCSELWHEPSWTGKCGYPCPSGDDNDCPTGQKCFMNFDSCVDQGLEVNGWQNEDPTAMSAQGTAVDTDRWCGLNFDDMASKCAVSCPNGTDDECPEGETCFADAPCGRDPTAAPTVYMEPTSSPKPTISSRPTPSPTTPPPTSAAPTSPPP